MRLMTVEEILESREEILNSEWWAPNGLDISTIKNVVTLDWSSKKGMSYLHDKLESLTLFQIMTISVALKLSTKEGLVDLERDLNSLSHILINNPEEEMKRVLTVEIYNFLTGAQIESMVDPVDTILPEKVDYMAAIRASCGR